MSRQASGYARQPREYYPSPPWIILDVLARHVPLKGRVVLEPACGGGHMVRALKEAGAKRVYASDVNLESYGDQPGLFDGGALPVPVKQDFLSGGALPRSVDLICTNPPFGEKGRLAIQFIERGLHHVRTSRVTLVLLLSVDFDSASTRKHLFGGCPEFDAKIVITKRINWFDGASGNTENHAWYVWAPTHVRRHPVLLYAP